MSKKIVTRYATLLIVFFSCVRIAHAGFEITEIMYDLDGTDTNREWVEVKNTGGSPADLSTWYLFSDNTKHALAPQGVSVVPAGGYAIIAQNVTNFRADQPDFSGLLFDSSWTGFNNDGETIGLKDPDLNIVSPVTYTSSMGGSGNGDSIGKMGNGWGGTVPTPGKDNQASTGGSIDPSSTNADGTPLPPKKKEIEVPKIITNIVANNTAIAGIPFTIRATTTGLGKEPLTLGRFDWNFGDGEILQQYEQIPFTHIYQYPGEYVITLSYYRVFPGKVVDASDRLVVNVMPREIAISSVGPDTDPYVELENKSTIEVDLSGWMMQAGIHTFFIPNGTIILPGKSLRFSPKTTLFTRDDIHFVTVYNSTHEVFAAYPRSNRKMNTSYSSTETPSLSAQTTQSATSSVINLDALGANAEGASHTFSVSTLSWIGFFLLIIFACTLIFILGKRNVHDTIEEKDIRVEDMMIME